MSSCHSCHYCGRSLNPTIVKNTIYVCPSVIKDRPHGICARCAGAFVTTEEKYRGEGLDLKRRILLQNCTKCQIETQVRNFLKTFRLRWLKNLSDPGRCVTRVGRVASEEEKFCPKGKASRRSGTLLQNMLNAVWKLRWSLLTLLLCHSL